MLRVNVNSEPKPSWLFPNDTSGVCAKACVYTRPLAEYAGSVCSVHWRVIFGNTVYKKIYL